MKAITKSLKDYGRGITGGLLFSLPLLYTMEVWWAGFIIQPIHLLLFMAVTFIVLFGYNRYAGMHEDSRLRHIMMDSIEEMGLGLVISFIVLYMLNRINFTMEVTEIAGKVILESMLVAIGVSIGRAQLGDEEDKQQSRNVNPKQDGIAGLAILSVCGAIIVAGNVAPTEEIILLAYEIFPAQVLCIVLFSLGIGSVILFFSDFRGSIKLKKKHVWYTITFHTIFVYLLSLVVSAFILWFFGRFEGNYWLVNLFQVLILGLPSMLGASAGRLLVK